MVKTMLIGENDYIKGLIVPVGRLWKHFRALHGCGPVFL